MYKLVLFDFDGTVIDGSEGIYKSINYALEKMGKSSLGEETLEKFIGPALFDSYMTFCEPDPENAEIFVANYRERYAPLGYKECRLYDGIKELLEKLGKEGFILAVCSSKPYDFVVKIAELLGVSEFFSYYSCPGFSSHKSEKDELIKEAAEHFGVSLEETVMIGDRHFDIEAAKKAGTDSVGVRYGFAEENELEEAGADMIADTAEDIYRSVKTEK